MIPHCFPERKKLPRKKITLDSKETNSIPNKKFRKKGIILNRDICKTKSYEVLISSAGN